MKYLIIVLFSFIAFAQDAVSQNYQGIPNITNYTRKDYAGSSQVWAISQDNRGILYFGNAAGLLEYDGEFWRTILSSNQSTVRSMAFDKNGTHFIGAKRDFGYLKVDSAGRNIYVSLTPYIENPVYQDFNDIWNTYSAKHGVFFISYDRIFQWNNNKITVFDFSPSLLPHMGFIVNNELYVVQTGYGLLKFSGKDFDPVPGGDFFGDKSLYFMLPFGKNKIIAGTQDFGLFVIDTENNTISSFDTGFDDFLISSGIYHGIGLPNNRIAIASLYNGILIYDYSLKTLQVIDKSSGLNSDNIKYLFFDKNSALWAATADGISRVEIDLPFRFFDDRYEINGLTRSICRNNGQLYIATNIGLAVFDSLQNEFMYLPEIKEQCWDLVNLGEGMLLSTSKGIYLVQNNKAKFLMNSPAAYKLFKSSVNPQRVYVGMKDGIFSLLFEDEQFRKIKIENYYPEIIEEIVSIAEEKNGDLWLSTQYQGLIHISENLSGNNLDTITKRIHRFGESHGISMRDTRVGNLNNNVVILNGFGGLFAIKKQENEISFLPYEKMYPEKGDFFEGLSTIMLKGNDNSYWTRFSEESESNITNIIIEGNKFTNNKFLFKRIGQWLTQPEVIFPDINEQVWFAASEGLLLFSSNKNFEINKEFNALIREVRINSDSTIFNGNYPSQESEFAAGLVQPDFMKPTLDYKDNSVTFFYSATCFETKAIIQYQFYLEGYEDDWSIWKTDFKKEYTNLPEGKYIFKVRAKNIYGLISEESNFEFTVLPPWYRTLWAYIIYAISALIFIYLIVWLNVSRLKKQKTKLEETVLARTEEIRQQNKKLEYQNNQILQRNTEISAQNEEIVAQRDMLDEFNKLLERKNNDITDSLKYAKRIQFALLPSENQMKKLFEKVFVIYMPKTLVSGDFYWAGEKDGKQIVAAIDCTGHGVPGAFLSIVAHNLLNEIINEKSITGAADILTELNRMFVSMFHKNDNLNIADGMDITICSIDKSKQLAEVAGAVNPVYHVDHNGLLSIIKGDRIPIGSKDTSSEHKYSSQFIEFQENHKFYLFSDGFADQFGGEYGKKLKIKNFRKMVSENSNLPIEEQKRVMELFLQKWMGYNDQVDDILVIGIHF